MLTKLTINNFILSDNITIEFGHKLNILTGETGAGKSVIVGALDYILGRQISVNLAYDAVKPVYLTAFFNLEPDKAGFIGNLIEYSSFDKLQRLVIRKEISVKGRSTTYINDKRINNRIITEIRPLLIDFHSQREQMKLFDEDYQLKVLDAWAGLTKLRNQYKYYFEELKSAIEKKKYLEKEEKRNAEKILLYEYQIEEIEKMELSNIEEKKLNQELELLANSEEILTLCSEIQHNFVEQDSSIIDLINSYQKRIEKLENTGNERIKIIITIFNEITHSLSDLTSEFSQLEDGIDLDQEKMNRIEERLNSILQIKTKYKMEIPQLHDHLNMMKSVVEQWSSGKKDIEQLAQKISELADKTVNLAERLSSGRNEATPPFTASISDDLKSLSIPNAVFSVDITSIGKIFINDGFLRGLTETGNDKIDFLFSANKGSDPELLKEVVSGGELSRLLLAIKKVLAGKIASPTLILDEIDTGIGGRTAISTGEYIKKIASYHQVLCITHLPQIASFGDKQFMIQKKTDLTRPLIKVKELSSSERRDEIARMLSGTKSEIALKHADELLEKTIKGE